jgi:hypothetical protein
MNKEYVDMWGAVFPNPVLVDSERWNGWAIPYFAESDLPELVDFMNLQEFTGAPWSLDLDGVRGSHTDNVCCDWNKFAENKFVCACECDECRELWRWETLDGARVVSVGGNSWCWSSSTPEELTSEILDGLSDVAQLVFWDLLSEHNHRVGSNLTAGEFILLMNTGNGWDITPAQKFEDSLIESAKNLEII